jgi:hypothetical protein
MNEQVTVENGVFGRRAVLLGSWGPEVRDTLIEVGVSEIVLNSAKGWKGTDISFLQEFTHLKSLEIIDWRLESIEVVNELSSLENLQLSTYSKSKIDFRNMPLLRSCGLEWHKNRSGIDSCRNLKKLFINRYDKKDLSYFLPLTELEDLAILSAPVQHIRDIRHLKKLRRLRIALLRQLTSLTGLEELPLLEDLWIQTCQKIRAIDELSSTKNLREVSLDNCGDITSLNPLKDLKKLERVFFTESTKIIDGDISFLLDMNLHRMSFQNRPHYSLERTWRTDLTTVIVDRHSGRHWHEP